MFENMFQKLLRTAYRLRFINAHSISGYSVEIKKWWWFSWQTPSPMLYQNLEDADKAMRSINPNRAYKVLVDWDYLESKYGDQ